jgi:16S rRNA (guanine966-N2)-methyltransferase
VTRIISGAAGGRTLTVPATGTRPTADRVREAVFSRFDALTTVTGSRVLDLYAGCGAVGLEAASRGATSVDLVDNSEKAVRVMTKNTALVSPAVPTCAIRVHRSTAAGYVGASASTWDIVFLDPPYDLGNDAVVAVLQLLRPRLSADAVVAVERASRDPEPVWPEGYGVLAPKDYGETRVYWLELAE